MAEAECQIGEIVDMLLLGVRVSGYDSRGGLAITAQGYDGTPKVWPMPPCAQVTRRVPAGWPPRPGDLWRGKRGELLFAVDASQSDETEPDIRLVPAAQGASLLMPEGAAEDYGPLTLVRREQQAGGEPHE